MLIDDVNLFKRIIESIEVLVDEVALKINEDGVFTRTIDLSKVAMIELNLPKDFFVKFSCQAETMIGISLNDLKTRLRRASSTDTITLQYNDELKMVELIIQGTSRRTFRFRTLVSSEGYLERVPKVQYVAKAKLLSKSFADMILDAEIVSEHVTLKIIPERVIAEAKSEEGETIVELDMETGGLLEIEAEGEASSTYKVDLLKNMLKASKIAETVDIYLANDVPLKMEYTIPGGGYLAYYLAPYIA